MIERAAQWGGPFFMGKDMMSGFKDHFSKQAEGYSRFRPLYLSGDVTISLRCMLGLLFGLGRSVLLTY